MCNDCFAYIFGKKFGKTPLIGLSPNKTWEGFLGAMIATFIDAILFSRFLTDPSYDPLYQLGFISKPFLQPIMTCKPHGIVGTSFSLTIPECNVLDIYKPRPVCHDNYPTLSRFLSFLPGGLDAMVCQNITWSSIQTHSVILAAFASLIAPFYGFRKRSETSSWCEGLRELIPWSWWNDRPIRLQFWYGCLYILLRSLYLGTPSLRTIIFRTLCFK